MALTIQLTIQLSTTVLLISLNLDLMGVRQNTFGGDNLDKFEEGFLNVFPELFYLSGVVTRCVHDL